MKEHKIFQMIVFNKNDIDNFPISFYSQYTNENKNENVWYFSPQFHYNQPKENP